MLLGDLDRYVNLVSNIHLQDHADSVLADHRFDTPPGKFMLVKRLAAFLLICPSVSVQFQINVFIAFVGGHFCSVYRSLTWQRGLLARV